MRAAAGVLALRVREHVDIREPAGTGDTERVLELPFRLAGEAADDVGRQRQLGNALVQVGDDRLEMLGIVGAVISRSTSSCPIAGEVKMPADAPAGRCEHRSGRRARRAARRSKRGSARGIPLLYAGRRLFEERPQEVGEPGRLSRLLVTPTVGAEVYPGEDDFLHAGTRKRAALAHDLAGIHAGCLPRAQRARRSRCRHCCIRPGPLRPRGCGSLPQREARARAPQRQVPRRQHRSRMQARLSP